MAHIISTIIFSENQNMKSFTCLLFLSSILAVLTLASTSNVEVIDQVVEIHGLGPQTGSAGSRVPQLDCLSWRLAVETNNIQNWIVPSVCENYVKHYMEGKQYRHDCEVVAKAAIEYVKSVKLGGDGKDVFIFDIDDTALSNLPLFARFGYGALPLNYTDFNEWIAEGKAPAIPSILGVYKTLFSLGIKPVFMTGAQEKFRHARIANLKKAGYSNWAKLVLRGDNDRGTQVEYKSRKRTELVNAGYRIIGNIGDQWSDLIGENVGARTFKVPNPMYYAA